MLNDPIDRELFLACSGRPHYPVIAHLSQSHSLPILLVAESTWTVAG